MEIDEHIKLSVPGPCLVDKRQYENRNTFYFNSSPFVRLLRAALWFTAPK